MNLVEGRLRTELADPRKAPKGKLPYLEVDGEKIPDSELIMEYLDGRTLQISKTSRVSDQRMKLVTQAIPCITSLVRGSICSHVVSLWECIRTSRKIPGGPICYSNKYSSQERRSL